ncbi:MAG TPA: hypothetical protein VJR46_07465 [Candidatus Dormibacteraeota bacterium]|nr:hypothetical protein [Candidatus Dormibacteraeota bacterium]
MRGASAAVGALRLAVAAAIVLALAYVLSWQILFAGPRGNDTLFHLHLAQWADTSFPGLAWWYRWDDHGIPYREGYPLAAHWLTAALRRLLDVSLAQAMQIVQFAITPLDALGVYVFCAWRLRRPLAGVLAAAAYLLSPIAWTFIVDWGFYSNQAGTVLFMPALIALDVTFEEWSAGRRTWRYRAAAFSTMALIALMGLMAPFLLGGALAAVFAYGLGVGSGGVRKAARWAFVQAPLILAGTFLLTAFWSLPQQAYLSFIGTHVPPRAFDPGLFPVWTLGQVFSLQPIRPDMVADRASISPAVGIPAAVGALAAIFNPRARVLLALVLYGLVTMTSTLLESVAWGVPVLANLVHARAGVNVVQFMVPLLAGLGLAEVPLALAIGVVGRARLHPRALRATAALALVGVIGLEAAAIGQFAHWVRGSSSALAYGDFEPAAADLGPPGVGCLLNRCGPAEDLTGSPFRSPPQRAVVDAHVPALLMDFHGLTGGSQAYTYNFQLPASPELDNWVLDSMLNRRGTAVKAEVASATGIDAVVLAATQAGQGADYRELGWEQVSASPLAFVNPSPSPLAVEWPGGVAALVIGADQRSRSHPYNDLFERATAGMIPTSEAWLVRGRSEYVDDYSAAELRSYPMLVVVGYRYHDQGKAWSLLDSYVRGGGSLYVETGWQYVDPDWNLGAPAPDVLPVGELRWSGLDPAAQVVVDGTPAPSWGAMTYGKGGWGASSAPASSLRSGVEGMVTVGGRIVVASRRLDRGRIVWSGMNLVAHDAGAGSTTEDAYVASLFAWLAGASGGQNGVSMTWTSDDALRLRLNRTSAPAWLMVKESFAPGWSAELGREGSSATTSVPLLDGGLDFIVVRLDGAPAGGTLDLRYGPTAGTYAAWAVSAACLLLMAVWVVRPRWFSLVPSAAGRRLASLRRIMARRFRWAEEDGA